MNRMNDLILGYDHAGMHPNGRFFETWPNGWPFSEVEVEALLSENFHRGNGSMVWDCRTKRQVIDNLVYHFSSPIVDAYLFNQQGKIPGFATIKNVQAINGEKYVFPFALFGSGFIELNYFKEKGITLSEKVKKDCRDGNCKILMHEFFEGHGFNLRLVRDFILRQAEIHSIPVSSFAFADSNYLTPKLQSSYGTKGFYKFWWERHPGPLNKNEYEKRLADLKNPSVKPYYFLCLNRRVRWHRTRIMIEIFNRWNDKCLWSHDKLTVNENLFEDPTGQAHTDEGHLIKQGKLTRQIYDSLPKRIDIDHSVNDTVLRLNLHEQAYINIVTETMFTEQETLFFSEKIYKPIVAMQPFILLGSLNSLRVLKEQGYRTFHPLINEDYDSIQDPQQRFDAVVSEVDRISKLSHEQMQELVKSCEEICIHNYQHWKKMWYSGMRDLFFLKEVKDWLDGN